MNGIHDMGGMHGLGPIEVEPDEPVFHSEWEAKTFVLTRAIGPWRKWNIDTGRHQIELIPAADYLRMTYYEKWYVRLVELLVKTGLVTQAEIDSGKPQPGSVRQTPPVSVERVPEIALNRFLAPTVEPGIAPLLGVGEKVRARNIHPIGHTRLPRYARGKVGTIVIDHGVHPLPDTSAHGLGDNRQHLYSVRFPSRELWGEQASERDFVYLDLWDSYLERI